MSNETRNTPILIVAGEASDAGTVAALNWDSDVVCLGAIQIGHLIPIVGGEHSDAGATEAGRE